MLKLMYLMSRSGSKENQSENRENVRLRSLRKAFQKY